MKTTLPIPAAAILLALSACGQPAPEVIETTYDPMRNQVANAPPVELPPAITADKTFRCKDNSLAYVTFFEKNTQVVVRTEQGGTPTTLRAATAGDPYTADGFELTGDASAITLTTPGKPAQSCRT